MASMTQISTLGGPTTRQSFGDDRRRTASVGAESIGDDDEE